MFRLCFLIYIWKGRGYLVLSREHELGFRVALSPAYSFELVSSKLIQLLLSIEKQQQSSNSICSYSIDEIKHEGKKVFKSIGATSWKQLYKQPSLAITQFEEYIYIDIRLPESKNGTFVADAQIILPASCSKQELTEKIFSLLIPNIRPE